MKKRYIVFTILFVFSYVWKANAETLSGYQDQIQRVFLKEAANKNAFTKAVQTARLLGFLEFMEPESFSKFHQCMVKERNWEYLSAQKRQTVLNECRGYGRGISGTIATSSQPTFAISPAVTQKQEKEMDSIRKDIDQLRGMIERLSSDLRSNQDQVLDALNRLSQRAPAQVIIPQEQSLQ